MASVKLDTGKEPIFRGFVQYFPRAIKAVAGVSAYGAEKYKTYGGFHSIEDGLARYSDAHVRHMVNAEIDGELDPESGLLHAAHEAWNAMAKLEIMLREKEAANKKANLRKGYHWECDDLGCGWKKDYVATYVGPTTRIIPREDQMDPVEYPNSAAR